MKSRPLFEARNLSKAYGPAESRVHALAEVNLSIAKGEFLAITGPSGSGKSTLLGLLGLLSRPSAGRLFYRGGDTADFSQSRAAALRNSEIGFVFQSFQLLDRHSALENVGMPLLYANANAAERRERALEALGRVGLSDRATHYPAELSGGEQQRVAIARAIINAPNVILADEPTGALDSRTGTEIIDILKALNRAGTTVVVITHNGDVAAEAHRQVRLVDGRLAGATCATAIPGDGEQ
jgi:putative ABC transport system ATP-binding protein